MRGIHRGPRVYACAPVLCASKRAIPLPISAFDKDRYSRYDLFLLLTICQMRIAQRDGRAEHEVGCPARRINQCPCNMHTKLHDLINAQSPVRPHLERPLGLHASLICTRDEYVHSGSNLDSRNCYPARTLDVWT